MHKTFPQKTPGPGGLTQGSSQHLWKFPENRNGGYASDEHGWADFVRLALCISYYLTKIHRKTL